MLVCIQMCECLRHSILSNSQSVVRHTKPSSFSWAKDDESALATGREIYSRCGHIFGRCAILIAASSSTLLPGEAMTCYCLPIEVMLDVFLSHEQSATSIASNAHSPIEARCHLLFIKWRHSCVRRGVLPCQSGNRFFAC